MRLYTQALSLVEHKKALEGETLRMWLIHLVLAGVGIWIMLYLGMFAINFVFVIVGAILTGVSKAFNK